jgi:ribosomal protein L37E
VYGVGKVREMSVKCPRCGEEMTGGICNNCGFPIIRIKKKSTGEQKKRN